MGAFEASAPDTFKALPFQFFQRQDRSSPRIVPRALLDRIA